MTSAIYVDLVFPSLHSSFTKSNAINNICMYMSISFYHDVFNLCNLSNWLVAHPWIQNDVHSLSDSTLASSHSSFLSRWFQTFIAKQGSSIKNATGIERWDICEQAIKCWHGSKSPSYVGSDVAQPRGPIPTAERRARCLSEASKRRRLGRSRQPKSQQPEAESAGRMRQEPYPARCLM